MPETWPLAETYWGKPGRPVHVLVRNENGHDWDSLCGYQHIDVGGTPCHYSPERVPEVATCRRCLRRWAETSSNEPKPYTSTHKPAYAYLDPDIGPVWSAVWVSPEQTMPTGPLTLHCVHRHRSMSAAAKCARTRCDEVRQS